MTTKRALGIVLAIIVLVAGSLILIKISSTIIFFSSVGIALVIVAAVILCVWLITSDK
jgi:hypothetical protein